MPQQAKKCLTQMGNYFFHCTDGRNFFKDKEGQSCRDHKAARAHAEMVARELRADVRFLGYVFVVVDETGTEVSRVPCFDIRAAPPV